MESGQVIIGTLGLITIVGLGSLIIDFWIDAPERNIRNYRNAALVSKKSILDNNDSYLDNDSSDDDVILNDYESVSILDDD